MPGDSIVSTPLSVSKALDSQNVYIRAKIAYKTDSSDETIKTYIKALNRASNSDMGITGNMWSEKKGNYIYLVDNAGEMLEVKDATTYTLSDNIKVPTSIKQAPEQAQYFENITFSFEWQAVQSQGLTGYDNIVNAFNELFPISSDEEFTDYVITYNSNNSLNKKSYQYMSREQAEKLQGSNFYL